MLESSNWLPLYGVDRTIIGRAKITEGHIEMDVDDPQILALMTHNLIGLSTLVLDTDRAEDIINKEKEKTDD